MLELNLEGFLIWDESGVCVEKGGAKSAKVGLYRVGGSVHFAWIQEQCILINLRIMYICRTNII
jgi:hypothetical protein